MAKVNEEVKAIVSDLDAATNKVAAKLDKAVAELEQGTVTEETLNSLRGVSTKLKALGADAENPIPTEGDDEELDIVEGGDTTETGGTTDENL